MAAAGFMIYSQSNAPLQVQTSEILNPVHILVPGVLIPGTFHEILCYNNFESCSLRTCVFLFTKILVVGGEFGELCLILRERQDLGDIHRSWVSVFYEQVGQEVHKFVLCTKKLVRLFAVYFSWMKGLDFYPGVLFLWFGKEGEDSVVLDVSVFWPEISVWCYKNISKKLSFIFHKVVFTLFGNVISTVFPPRSLWPPPLPRKAQIPPQFFDSVIQYRDFYTMC